MILRMTLLNDLDEAKEGEVPKKPVLFHRNIE